MKKNTKKILSLALCIILLLPAWYYFLIDEIFVYHPYETVYYDNNNEIIASTIKDRPSLYVPYEEIPPRIIDMLLLIEDEDFFNHHGFDVNRIISSTIHNITSSSSLQGASTITMQLARMLYLNQEQSITRKIEEFILAQKLENSLDKQTIIEYYLNLAYFAHGIYGIKKASQYYFNKGLSDLCDYEIATLIGIINAPNLYSPYIDFEESKRKTISILRQLVKKNYLSANEYYEALNYNLVLTSHNSPVLPLSSYYLDAVNEELSKLIDIDKYSRHGLKIKTFLNPKIQSLIKNVVQNETSSSFNASVCVMEVGTGKVLALVGGKNYQESSFNRALHAKKQIGSTIKPFLYYLALVAGFTPFTQFKSEKTTFHIEGYGDYQVSNASEIYANRDISMLEAIAMSDNIYAIKTILVLGSEKLKLLFENFGLSLDEVNPTFALGSNSLTPLELTSLYNCIASGGIYYKPKFISSIELTSSYTAYQTSSLQGKRVLFKKPAEILRHLLRAPFDEALKTYSTPSLLNYYVSDSYAGKTGSTDSSSWVMGYSPKYTIGVYTGTDDNSPLDDALASRRIFYSIAKELDEKNDEFFTPSSNIDAFSLTNKLNNKTSFTYYQ